MDRHTAEAGNFFGPRPAASPSSPRTQRRGGALDLGRIGPPASQAARPSSLEEDRNDVAPACGGRPSRCSFALTVVAIPASVPP